MSTGQDIPDQIAQRIDLLKKAMETSPHEKKETYGTHLNLVIDDFDDIQKTDIHEDDTMSIALLLKNTTKNKGCLQEINKLFSGEFASRIYEYIFNGETITFCPTGNQGQSLSGRRRNRPYNRWVEETKERLVSDYTRNYFFPVIRSSDILRNIDNDDTLREFASKPYVGCAGLNRSKLKQYVFNIWLINNDREFSERISKLFGEYEWRSTLHSMSRNMRSRFHKRIAYEMLFNASLKSIIDSRSDIPRFLCRRQFLRAYAEALLDPNMTKDIIDPMKNQLKKMIDTLTKIWRNVVKNITQNMKQQEGFKMCEIEPSEEDKKVIDEVFRVLYETTSKETPLSELQTHRQKCAFISQLFTSIDHQDLTNCFNFDEVEIFTQNEMDSYKGKEHLIYKLNYNDNKSHCFDIESLVKHIMYERVQKRRPKHPITRQYLTPIEVDSILSRYRLLLFYGRVPPILQSVEQGGGALSCKNTKNKSKTLTRWRKVLYNASETPKQKRIQQSKKKISRRCK